MIIRARPLMVVTCPDARSLPDFERARHVTWTNTFTLEAFPGFIWLYTVPKVRREVTGVSSQHWLTNSVQLMAAGTSFDALPVVYKQDLLRHG